MWIPDHLACLLRNLYVGQEEKVRIRHWTMDWFRVWKRSITRLYRVTLFVLLTCRVHHVKCLIGWLTNLALESKLPAEKLTTWDMQMAHFNGRKWIGTKEPLNGGERGEWKSWLNENTAPCPITSWQIEERKVETLTDFYFLWLQNHCGQWL